MASEEFLDKIAGFWADFIDPFGEEETKLPAFSRGWNEGAKDIEKSQQSTLGRAWAIVLVRLLVKPIWKRNVKLGIGQAKGCGVTVGSKSNNTISRRPKGEDIWQEGEKLPSAC